MPLLGHVVGGAIFGLAARFWQLGIQRRPMTSNLYGHAACVGVFGVAGAWWWNATVYMQRVLEDKEGELRARRKMLQRRGELMLTESEAVDTPAAEA
ncbi:hypothetical protein B0H15DRAFT_942061 [Mycena belliarum]|uniref:Uncharacterized protein n=1 Tax=Mycena belliarum TaxID=1033014 RepID=A0AAD6UIE1_9AGAR|nr:hypothetical protein B0H15DRAFT_942061 [Mycena belliae]